ncbi:MAG: YgaP family membrane protein [Hylemonella sp.]
MKANVGGIDRKIRIVAGLVLVGLAATGTVGWWGWLGLLPLGTGLIGWCPPYSIFGINTCSVKDNTDPA